MKKFICLTLCVLMALASMTSLVACSEKTVKLGLGLHVATPTVTNATEDGNGKAQATVTIAAVTLNAAGKKVFICHSGGDDEKCAPGQQSDRLPWLGWGRGFGHLSKYAR